jgi:RNA polymerase sigma factor (sigma-70 family)
MIPDFQNWTPEHCKEIIVEYQETKNPELLAILLARFDRYILYVIYEMRKKSPYLWDEEVQDLYHTGILGFHKGILAFKPHLKSFFIILVIKAYVKSELKQFYSYKNRETVCEELPTVADFGDTERQLDANLLFDFVEKSEDLLDREKELLKLRFKEGKTVEDIAQIVGLAEITIYHRLERVVKKLKKLFPDFAIEK